MKKEKKRIITIALTDDLHNKLLKESESSSLSMSAIVRLLIIKHYEKDNCEE